MSSSAESPAAAPVAGGSDHNALEVNFTLRSKRASRAEGGQVCIVSKCNSRLDSAYSRRYRLCPEHMKAPQFLIGGELHRWCQKCGKFHLLTQFEGVKRSCRVSLERHNEKQKRLRVRKQAAAAAAAAATTPVPVPTPCESFSGRGAPVEISLSRAGSDASDATLGPAPMGLARSTTPAAVIVVEPLPPPPMVFMLDEMSVAVEATSLPPAPAPAPVDVSGWDAVPLPSPAVGTELEIDEFLAELMPEAEMSLDGIDFSDLEDSLFGGCGAAGVPAAPAALDWAFAQF